MPDWKQYVRQRLPLLALPGEREAEIVEELAQQLEQSYTDALAEGASGEEAFRRATAQFPEWSRLAREIRVAERPVAGLAPDAWHMAHARATAKGGLMTGFLQDLRYAARMLRKQPAFTLVAVLTLALGIGANAAIFTVINTVLLRPLPFADPERLTVIQENNLAKGWTSFSVAPPHFLDWQAQSRSFERMAALNGQSFNYTGGEVPERLAGVRVTEGFFEMLGVTPVLGRHFSAEEFQPGTDRVVLLTHAAWQNLFAGRTDVPGRTMMLNGESYTIVGVLPADYRLRRNAQVWAPLVFDAGQRSRRGAHYLQVMGRLKPGVALEQAQQEMNAIAGRLAEQYPDSDKGWGVALTSLYDAVVGDVRPALQMLMAGVAVVLLIACANVANMLLARASVRTREIAVRAAIGASRLRLTRQLLTESVLLALVGGAVGMLLAVWGTQALLAIAPGVLPRASEISVDLPVVGFLFLLCLLTGVLIGLVPAAQVSRMGLSETLKESTADRAAGMGRRPLRNLFVVAEVSLALILLVASGLLIQSFARLTAVAPGFRTDHALTATVVLPRALYPEPAQSLRFFRDLEQRAAALPGVESAALTSTVPLSGEDELYSVQVEGEATPPDQQPSALYYLVSSNYHRTMGIPLLAGRGFTEADNEGSTRVCIVSDRLARRLFRGQDPIGRRIRMGRNSNIVREVVGVSASVKHYALGEPETLQMYEPFPQMPSTGMNLVLRTSVDPASLAAVVRKQVMELDPRQPVLQVSTVDESIGQSVAGERFRTVLLSLFGGLALVLAVVGVYGVMSYSVAQRTREIGIRLALGAEARDVLRLVMRKGLALTLVGVAVGLAGSFALVRAAKDFRAMLFGIEPTDAGTFAGGAVLLVAVAALACYIPARRAMRVDPLVALRYE